MNSGFGGDDRLAHRHGLDDFHVGSRGCHQRCDHNRSGTVGWAHVGDESVNFYSRLLKIPESGVILSCDHVQRDIGEAGEYFFEKELQSLFFQTNNMDVWQNIMKRVAEMNAADSEQAKKDAIENAKAQRRQEELNQILLVTGVCIVAFIFLGWMAYEAITFCQTNRCGGR